MRRKQIARSLLNEKVVGQMIYISVEQVIKIHDDLIKELGGMPGIRDKGLLESAVTSPMMSCFGEEMYKSVYTKASAYLFFLCKNHPFFDANKRTSSKTALMFLRANGKYPKYSDSEFEEFVVSVAEGSKDIEAISKYLQKICN